MSRPSHEAVALILQLSHSSSVTRPFLLLAWHQLRERVLGPQLERAITWSVHLLISVNRSDADPLCYDFIHELPSVEQDPRITESMGMCWLSKIQKGNDQPG